MEGELRKQRSKILQKIAGHPRVCMAAPTSAEARKKNHDLGADFIIKRETECKDLGNLQPGKQSGES